jgi:Fic family protein
VAGVRYIHEHPDWPRLHWRDAELLAPLADVRRKQGYHLGRMAGVGFDVQAKTSLQTVTQDVLTTSAIEGEALNPAEVRSSVARRLHMDVGGVVPARREVEGIVEVMLDATQNFRAPLTVADMALARADGTPQRFYSMSAQIEAERREYYLELELAQRGTPDITGWLAWFLGCLGRAIDAAGEKLDGVLQRTRVWERLRDRELNERQQRVLRRLLDDFQGHLTSSKYAAIAKCSSDTALRDIHALVAQGVLWTNPGRGRSTSYRLAPLDEA